MRNPNAQRPMTSKVRHWKRLKKMDGRIISAWQQTNTFTNELNNWEIVNFESFLYLLVNVQRFAAFRLFVQVVQ